MTGAVPIDSVMKGVDFGEYGMEILRRGKMRRKVIAVTTTLILSVMLLVPAGKSSFAATLDQAAEVLNTGDDRTATKEFTGTTSANQIEKYGNVRLDIESSDFLDAGYEYGDVLNVSFLDQKLEAPFCNGFFVDIGKPVVLVRDGYIAIAINKGDFATTYGIAVKNIASDNSVTWSQAEGVPFPVVFTISMNTPGGYYEELQIRQMSYTNEREDYSELSDEQFANFREVTTTGIGKSRLYRSASPINPRFNRNTYADAAIKNAGVTVIMNLADDETAAKEYEGYDDSYYSKQKYTALNMALDFTQDDFKNKFAKGLRFFIDNPGVYHVHCTEGKDRAGTVCAILECLMGAGYDELVADYMVSFYNYYGVKKGDEKYDYIVKDFETNLNNIFGIPDLKKADLQAVATEYMKSIGLSDSEINALKANLGADNIAPKTPGENAIEAMNKGYMAPGDTTKLKENGKKYELDISSDCQLSVVKGNKFFISNMDGTAEGDYNKELSISKKGKVSAKKPAENLHFWFNHKETGKRVTVSINIIEPSIDAGNKLKAETKTGETFDFVTTIPLNAEFDTVRNKGAADGLIYSGVEAIGKDGKLHIKGTALKKGKITIPFTVYGKKFKAVIKVKP